ncbi:PKD domain-containing protein [Odoribacter sp. Z80]|uniref:PKD domain-containing protein n=1 Tax=Odoribacter sp. Z80 TaxID=2304575 RepID=UPI00137ADB9A|nr:PKD domain-containing protein [Odoribacter sp. Z80]NCE71349.1 hypothetical protein [Odoribacter sp. Z80]
MFATKKILFYWCFFFLFCGQVFSQEREKVTPKPCPGVVINGVCWAECNVDEPGTFAATPLSYGMLYTWNQKKAWPLETQDTWGWSGEHFYEWTVDNDPCPSGWRVPTIEEFQKLLDRSKVTRTYFDIATPEVQPTGFRSIWGWKFTDNYSGNSISLVRAGMILYDGDYTAHAATSGYWTRSLRPNRFYRYYISMSSLSFEISSTASYEAMSVRCVVPDWEASPCDTILKDTAVVICKKDLPYLWGDTIFDIGTESGVYRFQYAGATGCDSIVHLHLNVHQPQEFFFSDAVCCGSHYNNYGFTLSAISADTVVSDTFQTRWGCDSIRTLSLSVYPAYNETFYDTICQGDAYDGFGFQLPEETSSGTFTKNYLTIHGCDSTVTLHLHVCPAYDLSFSDAVCCGSHYNNYGFTLSAVSADTVVSDTFQTRWGCDSIRTLSLTVNPLYDTLLYDTVCYGEPYYKYGFQLPQVLNDGVYHLPLVSQAGCDSILSLYLTVLPVFHLTVRDSVCPSERYDKHGFHLSDVRTSGLFRLPLQTVHGCDSVITLELYVYPTYFHPRTEYICYGDTVDFRGRRLYESGIYYDSLRTVHGCDSIYNLDLTVHPVYDIRFSGVLCEGSSYTGYDFDVSEAGVHQHRLKSVHGCDSVVTLTLTEEKKIQGGIGFLLDDCSTHKYRFFLDPPQPLHTWQWEMGDGTVYRSEEGFHRYADSGVYRIQLRTETDSGCENHFSHVQQVPSYLSHVPVHADRQVIDENYPTVRFRTEVPSDMEGVWNFGDGTTAKGDSVIHTFDATSREYYDVTLRVMNADSCITENSLRIEVLFLPKPVNTFSPNGDGVNDIFMADYRIEIIDRNGLRIYAGDNGWDGTCKGRQVPEDTYFFRLYYRTADGERVKTGYVTLVR